MNNWPNYLAAVAAGMAIVMGGIIIDSRERKPLVAVPNVESEYQKIGNGIHRTDDYERGVSCYKLAGVGFSCVKTMQ